MASGVGVAVRLCSSGCVYRRDGSFEGGGAAEPGRDERRREARAGGSRVDLEGFFEAHAPRDVPHDARVHGRARYLHMEGPRLRHTGQFVRWRPDRDPRSWTFEQLEEPVTFDLAEILGS